MNKYLTSLLFGLLLVPSISFAQTVEPTSADIIQRISVLEALVQTLQQELHALEAQQSVPTFGGTAESTSTIPIQMEVCGGVEHTLVGNKVHPWCTLLPEA